MTHAMGRTIDLAPLSTHLGVSSQAICFHP